MTPHWLRHTCATWLTENDCPLWDAASFTGIQQWYSRGIMAIIERATTLGRED
ncbi:MAG TPA: hypothetical protein PKA17_06825 [Phenylobacterium sp.]|nr:hypothetical protein [Phenylobacterium sp.]